MSKTKIPDLKSLIKKVEFSYVNSDITETNFPKPDRFSTDYKVFSFDRYISSEDIIKEMQEDGYVPANIYELFNYKGKENLIVALGSVAELSDWRCVGYLYGNDSERSADLGCFDGEWTDGYRFLAVRNCSKTLKPLKSELGNLDTLTSAIKIVIDAGYIIYKKV